MPGLPARTFHQRQRPKPTRSNNSVRRTYDLLRWSLFDLEPDSRLVEEDLIDSLSASRNTVRTVLRLLADQGLVTRGPKIGTTVSGAMIIPVDQVMTVPELPEGTSFETEGRVIESMIIPAPTIVRERLHLPAGSSVLMIEGLLLLDGAPMALTVSYVGLTPEQQAAQQTELDTAAVQVPDGLAFLEERLQVCVGRSSSTVGAVAADAQTASLLAVEVGAPLLWLEDLLNDVDGRPRALCQYRLRSDRVAFSANISRRVPTFDARAMD